MSFLGSWRNHDQVLDGLGAEAPLAKARALYPKLRRMSKAQLSAYNERLKQQYNQLSPDLQRLVDRILERDPTFDPRALHGYEVEGLGWAEAAANIAQAGAAIASVAIAFEAQKDARKDARRAQDRQAKMQQEQLEFERSQAQQQLEMQKAMMAQNAAERQAAARGGGNAAPGGGMAPGTKKALMIGGAAVAAGAVALAVAK